MASQLDKKKIERLTFPDPLIIQPQSDHHQTFIILHGRGSTALKFAPPLLATSTPSGETVQSAFPHAKVIFPTATRNRATIYKRSYTHQWFDHWHLEDYEMRQELQRGGLKKSATYIHSILKEEIRLVGSENVVLWGLSQGCATSLASLLTWDGDAFAAVVGMCGYLPFGGFVAEIARGNDYDLYQDPSAQEYEDPFSHSGDEDYKGLPNATKSQSDETDLATQAATFFREEIEMETTPTTSYMKVPIFLGHGTDDNKVAIRLGRDARSALELLGADVQMIEYKGLGHWYSPEMLSDIFEFLKAKLGDQNKFG